ncbi:MAG TPA: formate dehydrogenase accessory sulfurtransferase FdhD [Candidatus Xenobia bacterium]|jgi:FdhD protein
MTVQAVEIQRYDRRGPQTVADQVAVEEPLEIRLVHHLDPLSPAEQPLSITMRTPGHDVELALGFLFAEQVVEGRDDVLDTHQAENQVTVVLGPEVRFDARRLLRHFFTASSCGVCGRAAMAPLLARPRPGPGPKVSGEVLRTLPGALRAAQTLFGHTAGVHAAAAFTGEGELVSVFEDVGRHNAVDKLVGAALLEGRTRHADRLLVVSGRTSYDIMQKAAVAGFPLVAAVGAPSSLAVDMARELDVTLIGFLSEARFNVYAGAERIG